MRHEAVALVHATNPPSPYGALEPFCNLAAVHIWSRVDFVTNPSESKVDMITEAQTGAASCSSSSHLA